MTASDGQWAGAWDDDCFKDTSNTRRPRQSQHLRSLSCRLALPPFPEPRSPAPERTRPQPGSDVSRDGGARPGQLAAVRAPPRPSLGPPLSLAALPRCAERTPPRGRRWRAPGRRLRTGCGAGHGAAPLPVRRSSHPCTQPPAPLLPAPPRPSSDPPPESSHTRRAGRGRPRGGQRGRRGGRG